MPLRIRFLLFFLAHTLVVLTLFSGTYYLVERKNALNILRQQQKETVEKLASVCRVIHTASSAIFAVQYIGELKKDPALAFAACLDSKGTIQVHSDVPQIGRAWKNAEALRFYSTRAPESHVEGSLLHWHGPVSVGQTAVGNAMIAYWQEVLKQELNRKLYMSLKEPISVALFTFVLAAILSFALAWNLSRPIRKLMEISRAIGQGQWQHQTSIAERKDELGSLAQEMDAAAKRLRVLDELKDEFISHVSHDLRNPMAALNMYASHMLEGPDQERLTDRHREMLSMMRDSALRLNIFVSNILDAAKMKAGRMEYHLQPTPLGPILQNVHVLFSILAQQKEIRLTCAVPSDLPLIMTDPQRIEHVINNLISNALKFTPTGGQVALEVEVAPDELRVIVRDNGKGIPEDLMPNLFKRFYQGNDAGNGEGRIQGSGLGLYIVKQTVEAMGGNINVDSKSDKGTVFILSFPISKMPR